MKCHTFELLGLLLLSKCHNPTVDRLTGTDPLHTKVPSQHTKLSIPNIALSCSSSSAALDCVALYGLHALLSTYSLIELTVSLGALEAITETACRGAGKLLHKVHVPRAGQGDSTNVVFGVKPPKRLARQAAATAAAAARAATLATSAATAPMTSTAQQRSGEASTKATGRNRGTHATQPSNNSSSNGGGGGIHATSRGVNGGGAPNSGTVQSRYAENAERAAAAAAAAALAATTAAAQAAGNATQSRHDVCR